MAARRVVRKGSAAGTILFKPFVVIAAKAFGPGPTRLRLVKLAHHLGRPGIVAEPDNDLADGATAQPARRAA